MKTRMSEQDGLRKERIRRQLELARKNKEGMKITLNVAELIREDRGRT
jgi:hypothetical protein